MIRFDLVGSSILKRQRSHTSTRSSSVAYRLIKGVVHQSLMAGLWLGAHDGFVHRQQFHSRLSSVADEKVQLHRRSGWCQHLSPSLLTMMRNSGNRATRTCGMENRHSVSRSVFPTPIPPSFFPITCSDVLADILNGIWVDSNHFLIDFTVRLTFAGYIEEFGP